MSTLLDLAKRITNTFTKPNQAAMMANLDAAWHQWQNKPSNSFVKSVATPQGQQNISNLMTQSSQRIPMVGNALNTAGQYVTNRYIAPVAQIPYNYRQITMPNQTKGQRFLGGVGLVGGAATLVPDPIGDVALPIYDLWKGANLQQNRNQGFKANLQPALQSFSGQTPVGLGEVITKNPNAQMALNVAELGGLLLAPGLSKAKRGMIDDVVTMAITKAKTQDQAVKRVDHVVDTLIKNPNTPEYLLKLKSLKASLNKQMYELAGAKTGFYKRDYAVFMKGRGNPDVNQVIDTLEGNISKIDNALTKLPPMDYSTINRAKLPQRWLSKSSEEVVDMLGGKVPKQIKKPSMYHPPWEQAEYIHKALNGKKVNALDYLRSPDRVLTKLGLGTEGKQLRQGWTQYEQQLPKEIAKVTKWYNEVKHISGSDSRIFDYLDGKKVTLSAPEEKVALEIKSYYADWAEKLKLPADKRVSDYVTHLFSKDLIQKDFPEDLAKLIEGKVAKSVYDPFLQHRINLPGYKHDIWAALDAYVKRGQRKYSMDPALEVIGKKSEDLDLDSYKYIQSYISRINLRPTHIDNLVDTLIKQSPVGYKLGARPVTAVTRNIRQWIYRGTLGLNVKSALKNLGQTTNTYSLLGEKYTAIGLGKTMRALFSKDDELKRVGVLSDNFVQDRQLSVTKQGMQKLDKGLFVFFDLAERLNRGIAFYGAKARALKQGKTVQQAVDEGIEMARRTQFTFSNVDSPVGMSSDIVKLFTQFMSYPMRQTEFVTELVKNKEYLPLARYLGSTALLIYAFKDLLGTRWSDIYPLVSIVKGESRIGGSPFFTLAGDVAKTAFNVPDQYGNQPDIKDRLGTLGNDLIPFLPAGVAGKRTIQGLQAYRQGYSQSKSGRVQYPIEQTAPNLIKSVLLGKSTTPEAINYFKTNASVLGENQSKLFKESLNKKWQYAQFMQQRVIDREVEKAKTLVMETGTNIKVNDRLVYPEDGKAKTVLLDREVIKPTLTQNTELDKELLSTYRSQLSSKANDIRILFELGEMNAKEAEAALQEIAKLKEDVTATPTKKIKIVAAKKGKGKALKKIVAKAPSVFRYPTLKSPKIASVRLKALPKLKSTKTPSLASTAILKPVKLSKFPELKIRRMGSLSLMT